MSRAAHAAGRRPDGSSNDDLGVGLLDDELHHPSSVNGNGNSKETQHPQTRIRIADDRRRDDDDDEEAAVSAAGGTPSGRRTAGAGAGKLLPSYYHSVCLLGYSLSFIIFGSQVSILGPTIKPLSEKLGVDVTDLSPLFTALGVSCIISGTPSGWVVDRYPTHHVLIVSLLIEAVGFSLVPLMPSVWSLTALYFVICFSYNFTNSAVFTSLGWMFPKRAGGALNLVLAMFGVGSFFIPLASEACSQLLGSALDVFWVVAIVSLLSTIPFFFVTSPMKPCLPRDPSTGLLLGAEGEGEGEPKENQQMLEAIATTAVVILVFCTTCAETAIGNWLFTYSSEEMGLDDAQSAFANSTFWGAFTIGRVFGVLISPLTTPSVLLLGSIPFSLVGASLPIVFQGNMTQQLILSAAFLSGFGNSAGYANALALLEQYVPVTGFINGVFGAVAGAACMVGPTLVAMLAKNTPLGYTAMAWVGLTFYALHLPTILTAMAAGSRLVAPPAPPFQPSLDAQEGERAAAGKERAQGGGGDLERPFLFHTTSHDCYEDGATPPAAAAAGGGGGGGGMNAFGSLTLMALPSSPRASLAAAAAAPAPAAGPAAGAAAVATGGGDYDRRASYEGGLPTAAIFIGARKSYNDDVRVPRVSLPGHYGSVRTSRPSNHTPSHSPHPPTSPATGTLTSRGQGGAEGAATSPSPTLTTLGGGGGGSAAYSGAGSLGYLAAGTHDDEPKILRGATRD